jgi:hypothetical protein
MKSTKHQHPSTREIPNTKHHAGALVESASLWSLKFEVSLELGAWNLELPQ